MKSARSHLCRQHPTSSYSISAEKDADIVQVWVKLLHLV
jgi:hypothetical protein